MKLALFAGIAAVLVAVNVESESVKTVLGISGLVLAMVSPIFSKE